MTLRNLEIRESGPQSLEIRISHLKDRRFSAYFSKADVKQVPAIEKTMANLQKKSYVADLLQQLQENPHMVLVAFGATTHKAMESFRSKLRAGGNVSKVMVLKDSLFRIAFDQLNREKSVLSDTDSHRFQDSARGQLALILMKDDWASVLKSIKEFTKEDETVVFKTGVIDGVMYEEAGLISLSNLPSKEQLIAKLLGTIKAPHSKFVYGLQFNTAKLVNVLKNASEKQN